MHVGSSAQAQRLAKSTPVTYLIFDLLWLDGHSLMALPYVERRERLAGLRLSGPSWQTPEHVVGRGKALLDASADQHLEGVLAKRLDSRYQPGRRSSAWLKVKNVGRQEVVVGGWMPGQGRRSQRIGALLVGVYDRDGVLHYAGRVGTGFTESELDRLGRVLAPLRRESSPFEAGPKPPLGAVFCEPDRRRPRAAALQSRQADVSPRRLRQARCDRLLRRDRPHAAAPSRRPCADRQALA
jgi:bifunctional non-homologous end joining protein LigD